jgi:hypothetical protein
VYQYSVSVFLAHFALGFAAKRAAPRVSLAVLFSAAQLADLLWPFLVAAGLEHVRISPGDTAFTPLEFVSYPYSHSLLLLTVWGFVFGYTYMKIGRTDARVMFILAALVVSHWVLDFISHRPDMPLYPGGPRLGLGLWNSVPATITVEVATYAAALLVYMRATTPRDGIGRWAFVALTLLLAGSYAASSLGGPPPSVNAIVLVGIIGGAIIIVLSWWADRHRQAGAEPALPGVSPSSHAVPRRG